MKKLLLSCFLALGVGASAQYYGKEGFEGGITNSGIGLWGPAATTFNLSTGTSACVGANSLQATMTNTANVYAAVSWSSTTAGQSSNGKAIDYHFQIRKSGAGTGTMYITYSLDEGETLIDLAEQNFETGTIGCATYSGTIPEGTIPVGANFMLFIEYDRVTGANTVQFDDLYIKQVNTALPGCSTVTFPANDETGVNPFKPTIKWNAAAGAESYKLYLGTTVGGTDILNGTVVSNSQYTLTSTLAANTKYYARVTAVNANGETLTCAETNFTTGINPAAPYCSSVPVAVTNDVEPITNVTFGGINNTTSAVLNGSVGHEFFLSKKAGIEQGESLPISIQGNTNGAYTNYFTVFVDWNQDGTFDQANEQYFTGSPTANARISINTSTGTDGKMATGKIAAPADALLGETRMRVIKQYNAAVVTGCAAVTYGQAEDYIVNVKAMTLPLCTTFTLPTDGATDVLPNPASITWAAASNASGYKVYMGTTSGGTDVANGVDVTTNSYNPILAANTQYFVKVVPYNILGTATGCAEISFTTGGIVYCAATHTTVNADRISNLTFANISNASAATTVTGGYEDFTTVIGKVEAGGSYPMTITVASGNANDKVKVWIDSNKNGIFEDSEMTLLTYVNITSTTGTVLIPTGAVLGNTRMRVRLARQASAANVVACGNISAQGRTQDYTLDIVAAGTLASSDVARTAVSVYPNPFTDVLKISDVKGVKSVSISDVAGRLVKTMKPAAELNVSDLKTGLYIVTLNMEDGSSKTIKAIKK